MGAIVFILKFDPKDIHHWAGRYPIDTDYDVENVIAPQVRERGYFTKPELVMICRWKTPRSKKLVASNEDGFIEDGTRIALSTPNERLRIEVLTLLAGVGWPTASVLLHFGHSERYPILDFRALWSLGIEKPPDFYVFSFWWQYTQYCRQMATKTGVTMRILDRALWQYSDENQEKA